MKKTLFSLFLLTLPFISIGQDVTEPYTHYYYLEEYNCWFDAGKHSLNDTIPFENSFVWPVEGLGQVKIKIFFKSMLGACDVEIRDLSGNLLAKGSYIDSLAMLCKYEKRFDHFHKDWHIAPTRYYQPLKDGSWLEKNISTGVMETKTYRKSFLIE